jgi:hypothetical protein
MKKPVRRKEQELADQPEKWFNLIINYYQDSLRNG